MQRKNRKDFVNNSLITSEYIDDVSGDDAQMSITESKAIMDYIDLHKDIFSYDINDDNKVYCLFCRKHVATTCKSGTYPLVKHISTNSHKENTKLYHNNSVEFISNEDWHIKILNWMVDNSIPLNKLDDKKFTSLLETLGKRSLYSAVHYTNNFLPDLYESRLDEMGREIRGKPFFIMFDESPDRLGRKILNIMMGELNEDRAVKPFLLKTVEIDIADSSSIFREINFVLQKIFNSPSETLNFKLLLSDRAAYCLKAGELLKIAYPNIKHVTCLCHGLHNFSETIRSECKTINKFICKFKKILKNNSKNKRLFKKKTSLPFPKFPVLTRWGTWIECASWIFKNIQNMMPFMNEGVSKDLLKIYESPDFDSEYIRIHELLKLPGIIKSLESSSLSIYEQLELVESAKRLTKDSSFLNRFDSIFNNNPDLSFFKSFSAIKTKDKFYLYAPLTTCWVERSFSAMKYILGDLRNMSVETLKFQLALYFNKI